MGADAEAGVRRLVQWLLRGGLALACALFAVGVALALARGASSAPPVRLLQRSAPQDLAQTIMAAGVGVLALTPCLRVAALIVLWARERDWRFVGVAAIVLATLSVAVALGH